MKFFIICFLINATVFGQDSNKLDEKGNKHGLWKGFYSESKRARYEGIFEHGKEVGVFKFFDDTKAGNLIATREFNTNDSSCYSIFYNQNKNKVSEGRLVNKKYEGEWKYYHEDLSSIMTLEFYVNGKLNGIRKVFYKSGQLAEETTYYNGVKNGSYKSYAENGVVLEESNFSNGLYNGQAIYRNVDNQIAGQGLYKNDKKVGIWKILQKGKLKEINMNYENKNFKRPKMPKQSDIKVEIKDAEKPNENLENEIKNKMGR